MALQVESCPLDGLLLIRPSIYTDHRGYFYESFSRKDYREAGIEADFVQDNQSFSKKGVMRGLHFQKPPHAQAKLVRVAAGTVYDVAVDLRPGSPTFGQYYGVELSDSNQLQFFIPRGFAHGFLVLSESALFQYKCDDYYHPHTESGLLYNDPAVGIAWPDPCVPVEVSTKDLRLPLLKDLQNPLPFV